MKYGKTFQERSVPQWSPYNVDYDALKHLIKTHTTRDAGQAVAIPGQEDSALRRFENQFFTELSNQHDRVDLFVKSKADEISRRLQSSQKTLGRLIERCADRNGKPISYKRREKFLKYDERIEKCGEDIRLLQRFVQEQRVAFGKILKKYKKWTGSRAVEDRFSFEVLMDPKSFTRTDFRPLKAQFADLRNSVRASTPDHSAPATPTVLSRRPTEQAVVQIPQQAYWNEYDDGSDAGENDPYMISIDPESDSSFPGAKAFGHFMSKAFAPVGKVKVWLSSDDPERRSLIHNEGQFEGRQNALDTTDLEDEAYASSNDFPSGYEAHYATFPSIYDQKLSRRQENLLFQACIGSFSAALMLTVIAAVLVATGRRRLRVEVDAGVITGVVSSLFFAIMGFACMLYRNDKLGWLQRSCVFVTFIAVCMLDGMLLVLIAETTAL